MEDEGTFTDAHDDESGFGLDRRELVKRGLTASAAAALLGPSAALGGRFDELIANQRPKRGGTLTIAAGTGGASDTFDSALANAPPDALRAYTHFDPLVRVAPGFRYAPGLAIKWTPNKDNTLWEIRLRSDVRWHDNKRFTADDVMYTLRRMGRAAHIGHAAVQNIRLRDLKKLSPTLLRVPLKKPNGRLMDMFVYFNSAIVVQDGATDFSKPVGTGPFKLQSWTPGVQSVSVRNPDYWDDPKPWVDRLVILGIADPSARLNALLSGRANWVLLLSFPLAAANRNNRSLRLQVAENGASQSFYMDVTKPPFNDVRVRQALKLVVDRQQMINVALNGYGIVANDLFGLRGMADYNQNLPQHQRDIEQARSLLRSAGQSDLTITLHTAPVLPGMPEAAQVFAQQAKAAGITVNVKTEDPGAYFNPSLLYGTMAFAQEGWPVPALSYIYTTVLDPSNVNNETNWNSPTSFARLQAAIAATGRKRQRLWNQVQAEQYNRGGYITWGNRRAVDAHALNVRPGKRGWIYNSNDFRFWDVWIA